MWRWLRLFEKKRGDRRTGSTVVGRIGEASFFGVLFLLGSAILANVIFQEIVSPTGAPQTIGLGFWLSVLVLGSFVLIGGGGVLWAVFHSGTSAERRAALVKKAVDIDLLNDAVPMPRDFPTLPADGNLTNSPGVVLAYRLPTAESAIWGLLAAALFCLAWNGMTAVLTVYAARCFSAGEPEWFLNAMLVPFYGVGGWAVYYFLHELVMQTTLGPTIVEISHHPLYPGGEYELLFSQTGNLRMKSLEIHLLCEEEATYHQGTDVRHESRPVYQCQLFQHKDLRIEAAIPLERRIPFEIPPHAMHSFQSPHNAVNWKIVVTCLAEGWPNLQRSFPVHVYPTRPNPLLGGVPNRAWSATPALLSAEKLTA